KTAVVRDQIAIGIRRGPAPLEKEEPAQRRQAEDSRWKRGTGARREKTAGGVRRIGRSGDLAPRLKILPPPARQLAPGLIGGMAQAFKSPELRVKIILNHQALPLQREVIPILPKRDGPGACAGGNLRF